MTEKLADCWQAKPSAGADTGEAMAEIVQADTIEPGGPAQRPPWQVQVGARAPFGEARDDIRIPLDPGQCREDDERRVRQENDLTAGFAIWQIQETALEVEPGPFGVENFA